MIQPAPFLDPRGQPKSGTMDVIGGPLDGDRWPCNRPIARFDAGFYAYGETREWSFVWVPTNA